MNNSCPKRETMSIEDPPVLNMWAIAALVGVFERKGYCTQEDHYDIISGFRRIFASSTGVVSGPCPSCLYESGQVPKRMRARHARKARRGQVWLPPPQRLGAMLVLSRPSNTPNF